MAAPKFGEQLTMFNQKLPPEMLKRVEMFQTGFGMALKNFAQLRGELHANHGVEYPEMLAYVLGDIETNLSRLKTLTSPALLNAEDRTGREDNSASATEVNP